MSMLKLKKTIRTALTVLTVLTLGAAPCLQAYQLSNVDSSCSISCCCGCGHSQSGSLDSESITREDSCCCQVSNPEPITEIHLEAQPRPISNPDTFADITCAVSDNLLSDIVYDQTFRIDIPLAPGPPLYVLNSSYLI
jgi:hypothetical protein